MKKIILDILILTCFSIFIYFLLNIITKLLVPSKLIEAIIFGISLTFFLLGVTYNSRWRFPIYKPIRFGLKAFVLMLFFSQSFLIFNQSFFIYKYQNSSKAKRGWKGKAHKVDERLGFAPIPNARAFHTFHVGEDIPMAYDSIGFRIPLADSLRSRKYYDNLDLLFLGCSFTYGDACIAEQTFPYLVAQKINGTYANGGVGSYGLAQMLILAEQLIPKYKPKYLVLQYSPWLIDRACQIYAPTYFGTVPIPFFIESADSLAIQSPVFESLNFSLSANCSFTEALRFVVHTNYLELKTKIKSVLGEIPTPTKNRDEVELYAFKKILKIAKKENTMVVVVKMHHYGNIDFMNAISNEGALFVNADAKLFQSSRSSEYYKKIYGHWRSQNGDSVLVDNHPNYRAHTITADAIANALMELP